MNLGTGKFPIEQLMRTMLRLEKEINAYAEDGEEALELFDLSDDEIIYVRAGGTSVAAMKSKDAIDANVEDGPTAVEHFNLTRRERGLVAKVGNDVSKTMNK